MRNIAVAGATAKGAKGGAFTQTPDCRGAPHAASSGASTIIQSYPIRFLPSTTQVCLLSGAPSHHILRMRASRTIGERRGRLPVRIVAAVGSRRDARHGP